MNRSEALIAYAQGKKVRGTRWPPNHYYYIDPKTNRPRSQAGEEEYYTQLSYENTYEIYKEPIKLVPWYRPKIIWYSHDRFPRFNDSIVHYNRSKDLIDHFIDGEGIKVLEWEEMEAPEYYEGVVE